LTYRLIGGLSVDDIDRVFLPDNGCIVVADYGVVPDGYSKGRLHFVNHNIFRLDKDGKVIWQVTREDQGKVNWALLDEMAREEGREGAEYGFAAIWCKNPLTGELPSTDMETGKLIPNFQWQPGLKLMARAWDLGNNLYELDVETGIAMNVSPPGPKRAW
jgi:hypothetical protein